MNRFWIVLAAVICLSAAAASQADSIKLRKSGQETKPVNGRIIRTSATEVEVETMRGATKTVAVNEIESIHFDGEPASLNGIRARIAAGEYEEADKLLETVKAEEKDRPEILADVDFYKALSAARQALGGNGAIADAGKSMFAFKTAYPNSYHYLEACEVMGDLLVASGKYAPAEKFYRELANAPWAEYKMRAGVGVGRALVAQGKTADALQTFDEVLNDQADSDQAEAERRLAKLGKARCLTVLGKTADAIKLAQAVVVTFDPDDNKLNAEAYNTLGTAWRKAAAREAKDSEARKAALNRALLAFLHVDVLYDEVPDAHAEALANLVELFTELHKSDHAGTCKQTLGSRYPDSPWTARVRNK